MWRKSGRSRSLLEINHLNINAHKNIDTYEINNFLVKSTLNVIQLIMLHRQNGRTENIKYVLNFIRKSRKRSEAEKKTKIIKPSSFI